jgi:hypothetical protein
VSGASGSFGYAGEGFVVGPVGTGGKVQSYTLGTTDGGVFHSGFDNFIVNPSGSNSFTMNFTNLIYGVSFDFEIFPNGDVPDGTDTNRPFPDFTFDAFLNNSQVEHFFVVSVLPGENGTFSSSPKNSTELAPQLLSSASFSFPDGVNKLVFIDWPERIGIDNLSLDFSSFEADPPPPQVETPEPSSVVLMGTLFGAAGLGFVYVQRRRAQVPALVRG